MDRREFLHTTSAAAIAATAGYDLRSQAPTRPASRRPRRR